MSPGMRGTMSEHTNEIDEQAAEWAVRLGSRKLLPEEQHQLDAWVAADQRHLGALVRARAAWARTDRIAALVAGSQPNDSTLSSPERRRVLAAAMAGAVVVGTTGWLLSAREGTSYKSGLGEQRRVPLADGSIMLLNTQSEAVVHFEQARREVRLVRGEALFDVAKDRNRPFVIEANGVRVRAVGTAFAVRVEEAHVDVTVTEGIVEVSHSASSTNDISYRVTANEQAVAQRTGAIVVEAVQPEVTQRRLAWRNGMVAFAGEPLRAAVLEVNRHNSKQIVIDDVALAERPLVGIFRATDAETFARTAAAALGVELQIDGDTLTLRPSARR